jgi:hypothetical protein
MSIPKEKESGVGTFPDDRGSRSDKTVQTQMINEEFSSVHLNRMKG